jgi:hypothetical protein
LELGELFQRFNLFLNEAAVGQCKNVEHGRSPSAPKTGGQVFDKAAMRAKQLSNVWLSCI